VVDTEIWLPWNSHFQNPHLTEDAREVVNASDIELYNGTNIPEISQQQIVSDTQNVPGLIWPIQRPRTHRGKVLMIIDTMETRRNHGNKKNQNGVLQCIFTRFFIFFGQEVLLENYYWRIVNCSHM
jgi:hypothetical protein